MNLERHSPGPVDPFYAVQFRTPGAPAPIAASGIHPATSGNHETDVSRGEALQEVKRCPLINPIDLFQKYPLDLSIGLFGNKHLSGKRTEFAIARIWFDCGGRLSDLSVG